MQRGSATILLKNEDSRRMVAAGARISTQRGTALEIFSKSGDIQRDLKLVQKVLSSGHKSVLEHQSLGVAFNDVSVLVEQFCIEFRLASFTVKSRRYVDFSDAGYVIPDDMNDKLRALYCERCDALFGAYGKLLELGVPREDARFVLPYGFRSNFFMTLNARELMHMIGVMLNGRGSAWPELRRLGGQLKEQFDELWPGVLDVELAKRPAERGEGTAICIDNGKQPHAVTTPAVELLSAPGEPMSLLETVLGFTGRYDMNELHELLLDARPRELEYLNYGFRIDGISLACVTHFTRHRMLSLSLHDEASALAGGGYVLPESIAADASAHAIYEAAFSEQQCAAAHALELGASSVQLAYFAMAGNTTQILISLNAREFLHFAQLRCCNRAQWEIRRVAWEMMLKLCETSARPLFQYYGPSCAVTGICPEGKMSCGRPVRGGRD